MTTEARSALGRIRPPVRTAALLGVLVLVAFIIRVDALRNDLPPSLVGETTKQSVLYAIGALAVGLVGLIGRRLGGDLVGFGAALLVALYPVVWNDDAMVEGAPLVAFTMAAVVLASLAVFDAVRLGSSSS